MSRTEWEDIDIQQFQVFIRDLTSDTQINLKHMIEDLTSTSSTTKSAKKKLSKKEIIIQANNKRLHQKKVNADTSTMNFLLKNIDDTDPYSQFEMLKTTEAKTNYKWTLLEKYWKKKKEYLHHVIVLYYHLSNGTVPDEYKSLCEKINKALCNYEVKGYMLDKLGDMLPPLNYWDKGSYTLDEWQKKVIGYIQQGDSVIVKAPTSAGKTFVAMATGIIHSKILYVCPAKPVAYQVGANFQKMGYKVHYLVKGLCDRSFDKQTQIFVGTPDIIEETLPKIGVSFKYAVYDEIHLVNEYEIGLCYENIIKYTQCPYLALSATIKNSDYLRDILHRYHNSSESIHYVEYDKRFINQQRWIYTDTLQKLHPMVCYDGTSSLDTIHFSPNDCYRLYEALSEVGERYWDKDESLEDRIDSLSPDEYFKEDRLVTLDESKDYERCLTHTLDELSLTHPTYIADVKTYLSHDKDTKDTKDTMDSLISLFKKCKKKDLLPMLYFHTSEEVSREICLIAYQNLQKEEGQSYPYHYVILEKKQDLYQKYKDKRETYSDSIKIKSKDALSEKASRLDEFDKRERQVYIHQVSNIYDWAILQCKKENSTHIDIQIKNLTREKSKFIDSPDFREQDIFQKHPSYCFTKGEPMSGNEIRDIKRNIKKSTGITIEYEDPLFQLLKRGIGLYLKSLPDEYNWIVQTLVSKKKLGIVISDRTLCLGIDLPIRSVTLSGYKQPCYSTSDYLQMSGRAGRRGKDKQGNIIFHGLSQEIYTTLMKGVLPTIDGSTKPMHTSYNVISNLCDVDMKYIYDSRINTKAQPLIQHTISPTLSEPRLYKLMWLLRDYENTEQFVSSLKKFEKKLFRTCEDQREYVVLQHISDILFKISDIVISSYKSNKIDDTKDTLDTIYEIGECCRHMINTLNPVSNRITMKISTGIFERCRTLIYKYRLL